MYLDEEIRRLHNENREAINSIIEPILKEHGITFSNPDYYKRCSINVKPNYKEWLIDGIPVFIEFEPEIEFLENKITATIMYQKL